MKKKLNVLSLFDGMSCGQIALERAGIEVDKYYASELDKHAIKVTQHNYPETIQLGDVTKWREWEIDWANIDLLQGGSPCQGFSFAGKQLAFDDPRSALFFVYVDILNHIRSLNPKVKFLLENVKMKREYLDVISEKLGVGPIFINSALVSAQNRQRYYWANWEFDLPEDKGILLRDVVEKGFVEKKKSWAVLQSWDRFPISTESAIGRYKRSMMPVVFTTKDCDFYQGWREMNRREVEKLQTLPQGYTDAVAEKKAKAMLGNGWTVDVIAHIFRSMK